MVNICDAFMNFYILVVLDFFVVVVVLVPVVIEFHYLKSGQNILLNHLLGSTEEKKKVIWFWKNKTIFILAENYSFNLWPK